MEEFFENIFVQVGLVVLIVLIVGYALYKWIIPALIKNIKAKKERKKAERERKLEESYEEVELVTKDVKVEGVQKEEVENKSPLIFTDYQQEDVKEEVTPSAEIKADEDEEFKKFLKKINKEKKSITQEMKNASPKLKALVISGALQDEKY